MKIRDEHLDAFDSAWRAGIPERLLSFVEAEGNDAALDRANGVLVAIDSRGFESRISFRADGLPIEFVQPSGATYRFEYTPRGGRISRLTTPGGEAVELGYDGAGNVATLTRPRLYRYELNYDGEERLTGVRFPDGSQASLEYDGQGRLHEYIDRTGAAEQFHHFADGSVVVEDALGRKTRFAADPTGALDSVEFPDGSRQEYAFDPDGQIGAITARDGREVLQWLDDEGRVTRIEWTDGSWVDFGFDDGGNLSRAARDGHEVVWTYTENGAVATESTARGQVAYTYDPEGRLLRIVTPWGGAVEYEYDEDGRISVLRDWEGRETRIVYAPDETPAEIRYGNGVTERQSYGRKSRLSRAEVRSPTGQLLGLHEYAYDVCERLMSVREERSPAEGGRRVRRMSYDAESRLLGDSIEGDGHRTWKFEYDRKGNLVRDGHAMVTVGAMDEPVRIGYTGLGYDALGRISRGRGSRGAYTCAHSADGLLREVAVGGSTWRFQYDALGRRVLKTDGYATWWYGWSGHQLLWEEHRPTPEGEPVRRDYLFLPQSVTPIAFRERGETYWLQSDARGAVIAAFAADGSVAWRAFYHPFGEAEVEVGTVRQPWRLLGQYHDEETGLHYNFARYYDPRSKTYLSRDPAWANPEATHYSYARNDPWNRVDPLGTLPLLIPAGVVVGGAILGAVKAAITGGTPWRGALEGAMDGLEVASAFLPGGLLLHVARGAAISFGRNLLLKTIDEVQKPGPVCIPCLLKNVGLPAGKEALADAATGLLVHGAGKVLSKIPGTKKLAKKVIKAGVDKVVRPGVVSPLGKKLASMGRKLTKTGMPLAPAVGRQLVQAGNAIRYAKVKAVLVKAPGVLAEITVTRKLPGLVDTAKREVPDLVDTAKRKATDLVDTAKRTLPKLVNKIRINRKNKP